MSFSMFSRPAGQAFGRRSADERLQQGPMREPVASPLQHPLTPAEAPAGRPADKAPSPAPEPAEERRVEPDPEPEGERAVDADNARKAGDGPAIDADIEAARLHRPWPPVSDSNATPDGQLEPAQPGAAKPGAVAVDGAGPAAGTPSAGNGVDWQHDAAGGSTRASAPALNLRPAAELPEEVPEDLDDIAVTIGRVVSIRGSVVWGALFDDLDGMAAKAARMGALVSMRGTESRVFGIVNALQRDQGHSNDAERTVFEIQILGEIPTRGPESTHGFQRGVSSYPPLDAPITTVTVRDLAMVYARPRTSSVHIGRLRHNRKVPAFVLTDSLLGKHFALLGTTGTGKSCAVTVVLRSILDQYENGHVILLDPHNEYASAFADKAELLNPSNLQLPYWLLNFEEIAHVLIGGSENEHGFAQRNLLKDAILRAKQQFAGEEADWTHLTIDTPVPYRLSDLIAALKEAMGALNKAERSAPFLSLIAKLESLRSDRRFAFMFGSLAVRDIMQAALAQLLRVPVDGKPITIIDISGVPSEIVDVVVSVLFRLIFELAMWSERGSAPPVLLVCEEAHRYVPEDSTLGFAPTKRVISRIAKEGRKYGVTLCLVSQRPSELAVSSLSQCNTVFALRLSNDHDQAFVARALPENARWLVDGLPSLNTQEAVVVGDGVTVPVHIRFADLAPEHRPSSLNPSFSSAWQEDQDPAFLERAIERWRLQSR